MSYRSPVKVRDADPDDLIAVRDVLVEAFLHADIGNWLVPHLDTRHRILRGYFAMVADHAIEYGHVEIADDNSAVALWYTIAGGLRPAIGDYDARLKEITGKFHGRFAELDRVMDEHHPGEDFHQHLAYLAVHPESQRAGRGRTLLAHHHAELDAAGTPAFVHAPGVRCRQLFVRHGYKPRLPYRIAPGEPQVYPLWRPPSEPSTRDQS